MAPQPFKPTTRPILCAVLDASALGHHPTDFARELFSSGVDWIQLRDRLLTGASALQLTRALVKARDCVASENPRRVIVNRRVDVAIAGGADGCHLGFDAIAENEARPLTPIDAPIGRSLHTVREVELLGSPSGEGPAIRPPRPDLESHLQEGFTARARDSPTRESLRVRLAGVGPGWDQRGSRTGSDRGGRGGHRRHRNSDRRAEPDPHRAATTRSPRRTIFARGVEYA